MSNISFVPYASFIDSGFWAEINRRKLNDWKLDESAKEVTATISLYDCVGNECRLSFSHDAFDESTKGVRGELYLYNTVESFKKLDRAQFLNSLGVKIWKSIEDGSWLEDPSSLNLFAFTIYADLKKFQYYYWNCSAAVLGFPSNVRYEISDSPTCQASLLDYYSRTNESVFLLSKDNTPKPLNSLKEGNIEDFTVVVADSSPIDHVPGWSFRNLIAAFAFHFKTSNSVNFISLKGNGQLKEFKITWDTSEVPEAPKFTGWETNHLNKLGPRYVDMRKQFDPVKLMEQSVGLNLSLIKWRLHPDIKLERFEQLKVLIFGAGTLGCNIARNLMAYNVKVISFIDNSTVSYSNPVRQSLSKFEDAKQSRSKAETAAAALQEIYPSIVSSAYNLTVPMPGHSIDTTGEEKLARDVEQIEKLVMEHDVIFLALDSREARWLPTVIANKLGKMAFSVALGFDTFVVIRHGLTTEGDEMVTSTDQEIKAGTEVPYSDLACYFCSDVTAPGNSMNDRTLDQQCTVSRPGLSPVASGVAVELLASVLQTPDPSQASANIGEPDDSSSILGATPHQVRGFMFKFHQITPCVRRFQKCVACGVAVRDRYSEKGWEFVRDVMNSPLELERLSGLDLLQSSVDDVQIDFDDNDSVMSL